MIKKSVSQITSFTPKTWHKILFNLEIQDFFSGFLKFEIIRKVKNYVPTSFKGQLKTAKWLVDSSAWKASCTASGRAPVGLAVFLPPDMMRQKQFTTLVLIRQCQLRMVGSNITT